MEIITVKPVTVKNLTPSNEDNDPNGPFSFEAFLQAYDDIEMESSFIADKIPVEQEKSTN